MRKVVYVVDDDATSLEVLVILVKSIDQEWQVQGFNSPLKALETIKAQPPDVLISDQCMAEMAGEDLLEETRKISPETIRIIMSGFIDSNRLSKILSAHQYIEKPFATHRIAAVIHQTFEAQDLCVELGIKDFITSLHALPVMPPSYHELLNALDNVNGSNELIAQIIAMNPVLSSRVLKVANSAMYRRDTVVNNLLEAVLCLGCELIKAIVISQQIFQQFDRVKNPGFDINRNREHCWKTGTLAQKIAMEKRLGLDASNEAFLAGLLHELGKVVLFDNYPQQYAAAKTAARDNNRPLHDVLAETFHVNPAHVTAYMTVLWGIPKRVVSAIIHQYNPAEEKTSRFNITSALYIADGIVTRKDPPDPCIPIPWDKEYLEKVGGLAYLDEEPE